MSSGLECRFFEPRPGKWFYALQRDDCPVGVDWIEDADVFGPFSCIETGARHLRTNHRNPGGWGVERFTEMTKMERKDAAKLAARAK